MHSVISQGKVEELLNSTPLSRRALVEEAAGLGRYKKRRERAQAKLERVQANLDRVADVEREVRHALRPLKQQMEAADRHAQLLEQLALARAKLLTMELQSISRSRSVAERESGEAEGRRRELEEGLERLRAERGAEEERFAQALRQREELATQFHRAGADLDWLTARGESLSQRLARLEAEASRASRRRESAQFELESAASSRASLEAMPVPGAGRSSWVSTASASLVSRLAETAPALAALEQEETEIKDRVFELEASRSRAMQEADFLRRELADRGRQAEELVTRESAATAHRRTLEAEEAAVRTAADAAEADRASLDARVGDLTESIARLQAEAERARGDARAADEHSAAVASRERVLGALLARREGIPEAARSLLESLPGARLVAEALRVAPGYERAAAAALGALSQAVMVSGPREPALLVDTGGPVEIVWLGAAAGERAGHPSGAGAGGVEPPAGVRRLWEVVTGDEAVLAGLEAVLPRTFVCDDLSAAPSLSALLERGARVVDRQGRVLSGESHGARRAEVGAETVFAATTELQGLVKARMEAEGRAAAEAAAREAAEAAHDAAAAQLSEAEAARRELEREAASLRDEAALLSRRREQASAEAQEAGERRQAAAEMSARLAADQAALQGRICEGDAALDAARAALHALRGRAEGLRRDVSRLEEKRSQAAVLLVRIRERQRAVEEERVRVREAHRRAATAFAAARTHEERLGLVLPPLRDLVTVVNGLRASAGEAADRLETRVASSRESSEGFAATLRELGRREAGLQREQVGLGEGLIEVQVRLAHLQDQAGERERELDELRRRHQSPREVDVEALADATADGLRAGIEQLERRRERLGPVNPLAEQEYRETEERAEFLAEQRRDLEASLAELRRVVDELDEHIETTFASVFEATRVHFESMVEVLFPGGRGVLKLVDVGPEESGGEEGEEDEAGADERMPAGRGTRQQGVALEVKPPRKAPRSLTLLSGGEKALAAIAFLFALFLARPCPFYILDEVEAALDDVNIGRFLSLVRRYQGQTQFIIITHQRRTMEIADSLFGVAMDPDGTSRVLSRRLAQEGSSRS